MIKINYPDPRANFDKAYQEVIINAGFVSEQKANNYLNDVLYNGNRLNLKALLVMRFHELPDVSSEIDKQLSIIRLKNFRKLFDYEKHQGMLAEFFMSQMSLNLDSCYYCNIDYINSFIDRGEYKGNHDFINNAPERDLRLIPEIGPKTADRIIKERKHRTITNLSKLVILRGYQIKNIFRFKPKNTHNHFTLDHVLPQSRYRYFSLCLYNLVPSCASCNMKFKKAKQFKKVADLKYVSPSSEKFRMGEDIRFSITYSPTLKSIKSVDDFILRVEGNAPGSASDEYMAMFKINGRYVFHKKNILSLIRKKVEYSDAQINEISKITGYPVPKLQADIFGKELYDPELYNAPLVKLKRDIAKDIGIPGV